MSYEEMYDFLADVIEVDTDALDLAFAIGGCNTETAKAILYYYTGWRSFEGCKADLYDEDEEEEE